MPNTIKSMRASVILGFAAILFLSGCQIDNLTPNGAFQSERKITIEATYEMPEMETKTVRDENAKIYWTPGDAISLFFGSGTDGGSKFIAQNNTVALKTTFSGSITAVTGGSDIDDEDTFFWGLYPYDATASCDGSSVMMSIPSVQPGKEGTFAPGMAPSLGRSQKLVLSFRNIWSGFGFTVSEPGFQSVTFRGNAGENIAGKARIGIDENNYPKVLEILDGVQEVTLTAPEGGFVPGQYYYMQFFPCTFESGFSVELVSATKRGTYNYTKSMEYPRSTWKRAATVDARIEEWVEHRIKSIPEEGDNIVLQVVSDVPCHAVIPEEAQSWISITSETKVKNILVVRLNIQPNTGLSRSATIDVVAEDNTSSIVLSCTIIQEPNNEAQLAVERESLIAFYNALDGDNWIHNDNWCSDKPINEWYGINDGQGHDHKIYDSEHVMSIYLDGNQLCGQIPEEFYNLRYLKEISLPYNDISGFFSPRISSLQDLQKLDLRNNQIGGDISFLGSLSKLTVLNLHYNPVSSFPRELCNLDGLQVLSISPLTGTIPTEIGQLTNLMYLYIQGPGLNQGFKLDGGIPEEVGLLTSLIVLNISSLDIGGKIPRTLGNLINLRELMLYENNLEGNLPAELGNLKNLQALNLQKNRLSGGIPSEYANMPLLGIQINNNCLSGTLPSELSSWMDNLSENSGFSFRLWSNNWYGSIPDSWQKHPKWKYLWHHIMASGGFDSKNLYIPGPDINGKDINGGVIESDSMYDNNNYTLLFEYNPNREDLLPLSFIDSIYREYSDLGIALVIYGDLTEEEASIIKQNHPDFVVLSSTEDNSINGFSGRLRYPATVWDWQGSAYNKLTIVNKNGLVSYSTVFDNLKLQNDICTYSNKTNEQLENEITSFFKIARGDNPSGLYFSSDYSLDGKVTQIQTSHKGTGVNIVLMGDGFSDRQIADGTYENMMQRAIDAFFSEEPYKSLRDYFNVYIVDVISPNEGYEETGITALSTSLSGGTTVIGNNARVISYGLNAIHEDIMEDCLLIVLMNKDAYAGTCYMYNPPSGNYGRGLAIAYFPVSSDTDTFNGLVSHEAGGHGFAKLADEYAYEYMGAIYDEVIASARINESYGWYKNIDFTNNPTQVKWSPFISDNRYANEGIGCYEGGFTYWSGVWRPTENSIMRHNTGGFNAPSRYAIWYRINKLAYGEDWNGTYEDFVAYDAVNRTPAATAQRGRNYVLKQLPPLAPPVVVGHSWREEK